MKVNLVKEKSNWLKVRNLCVNEKIEKLWKYKNVDICILLNTQVFQ